jgi:hypothetical protein
MAGLSLEMISIDQNKILDVVKKVAQVVDWEGEVGVDVVGEGSSEKSGDRAGW